MSHPIRVVLLFAFSSSLVLATEPANFEKQIQPILKQYCFGCHGSLIQEAELRLDNLPLQFARGPAAERWHDVLNRLNRGEMPPPEAEQLPAKQAELLAHWLTTELKRAAAERNSTGGRVVLRRLNRYEYQNTMRDLLGIDLDFAKNLPPDPPSEDGFQNNGAALGMSPLQIEYYLKAAREALAKVIVTGPAPEVHRFHATKSEKTRRRKESVGNQLDGNQRFIVRLMEFPRQGEIVVRVRASAQIPDGKPFPRLRVSLGVRADTLAPAKILGEVDVSASPEKPEEFVFRGRIEDFPLPGHNPKYPGVAITLQQVTEKPSRQAKSKGKKEKASAPAVENAVIIVESVEFIGPVVQQWPPSLHAQLLPVDEESLDEEQRVRLSLERFMKRAYRRPVSEDELELMLRFYQQIRPGAPDMETALRETLALVLISPEFLYLAEPRQPDAKKQPLDDFEIATRLSYFLWSTMPDEELFSLAAAGKLQQPSVREQQVRRMLQDERAEEFVRHFTDQWLNLSGVDRVAVNPEYYRGFDERLKQDMQEETRRFFGEILRNDLSSLNLIDSDFTMANHRLAKHYGIAGPRGEEFERVALAADHRRGGLLTQGSMLLTNSTGEDSHPIRRAVWLLDRLLGDPPPPPPPDVPELDQDEPDFAKLPLKRQLEIHRQKAACNSCHRRIDPWGIPFEHYDAVGQWRDDVKRVVKGKTTRSEVVAKASLPDGTEVDGVPELKAYLLEHERERFAHGLTSKLYSYALGRSTELADEDTLSELEATFAKAEYRLSDLIVAIVQSEAFLTK